LEKSCLHILFILIFFGTKLNFLIYDIYDIL